VTRLLPEFFMLLGINVFLSISLLTCLLDRHFPSAMPFVYQVAALAGFGQLWISRTFMSVFGDEMRFWYCLFYLVVAVANVISVNFYVGLKKMWALAGVLSGAVTFPTVSASLFFISVYAYGKAPPLPFPAVPVEITTTLIVFCLVLLGVCAVLSLKPGIIWKIVGFRPGERYNSIKKNKKEG